MTCLRDQANKFNMLQPEVAFREGAREADKRAMTDVEASDAWFDLLAPCLGSGRAVFWQVGSDFYRMWLNGNHAKSQTNYYTDLYQSETNVPAQFSTEDQEAVDNVSSLRFEALPEGAAFEKLIKDLKAKGFLVEPFRHFGNWSQQTAIGYEAWWAARPTKLRNTVKRQTQKLDKLNTRFEYFSQPSEADAAVRFYTSVAQSGWQPEEPHKAFLPGLIHHILSTQSGVVTGLSVDGKTIAAQIWLSANGTTTLFKLAHDPDWQKKSPGSVLTHLTIERVFADNSTKLIDFGRGDDAYKESWMSTRQQRWGILAINPRSVSGLLALMRDIVPGRVRRIFYDSAK